MGKVGAGWKAISATIIPGFPVRVLVTRDMKLHSELVDYAVVLNGGVEQGAPAPEQLVAPMLARFIAADREFTKARRARHALIASG